MRSMDVMRPGESSSLRVITSQCFIFALFKTHCDRFLGHACPCRAASASCRRHATVGAWPCCRASRQGGQHCSLATSTHSKLVESSEMLRGMSRRTSTAQRLSLQTSWLRKLTDVHAGSELAACKTLASTL